MLKDCVLLGLDWVEPMMQLCLARHMFMHFSCIHILSFPFLFSVMMVLFCLSPSLSLSLLDRLCMAPKCNTTPSRNPLHSRTSSSDPTPLHVQFFDEKAQRTFWRTSPHVVFIRSATWFYWTFLILLYPLSFTKHFMLELCKRSEVPKHGDDFCSPSFVSL